MTAPFTHKPLERPSFFLRLLGRQPKINGLIEMNNLLAQAEGIENVSMQQVDEIATRYRIRMLKDLKDERRGLCGDFLRYCIEDHRLDTGEADRLQHLRRLLRLSEEDVAVIQRDVASSVYEAQADEAMRDRKLSDQEQESLERLARDIQLPDEVRRSILARKSHEIMQSALDEAIDDARLSPTEEAELEALASNLRVKISHDDETRRVLERMRLYWRIEEGDLPVVDVDIKLQRSETCHFATEVDWLENRKVTTGYNYSGPTARIRIVKGVYWRLGSMSIKPMSEDVLKHIDSGKLYVTSKRVLFRGEKGNKSLKLNRIIAVEAFSNGVQIEKDKGKTPFVQFESGTDVMGMILERAIDESV